MCVCVCVCVCVRARASIVNVRARVCVRVFVSMCTHACTGATVRGLLFLSRLCDGCLCMILSLSTLWRSLCLSICLSASVPLSLYYVKVVVYDSHSLSTR